MPSVMPDSLMPSILLIKSLLHSPAGVRELKKVSVGFAALQISLGLPQRGKVYALGHVPIALISLVYETVIFQPILYPGREKKGRPLL